jgi:hypothetical protein
MSYIFSNFLEAKEKETKSPKVMKVKEGLLRRWKEQGKMGREKSGIRKRNRESEMIKVHHMHVWNCNYDTRTISSHVIHGISCYW